MESYYSDIQEAHCIDCGTCISLELQVVEYPQGAINHVSMNSSEATITQLPTVELMDEILLPPAKDIYVPDQRLVTDVSRITNTIPELIRLIQEDSSCLHRISPREFEEIIAEIFRAQGYDVRLTKRTRDGGKDVIAIHRNELGLETCYFIECKRHALDRKVDVGIVRGVYGVHSAMNGPNKSIVVTTSTFTPDAREFVGNGLRSSWDMELKDIRDVMGWIKNYKL
ncbi:restriction endonuclease [Pusillimonas noertemannii]|nr:restriction endonuclease [Pusillimonas noertemannii]NYT69994.1 restriction endonuclease [Pusillimonas noertemannii]